MYKLKERKIALGDVITCNFHRDYISKVDLQEYLRSFLRVCFLGFLIDFNFIFRSCDLFPDTTTKDGLFSP